MNNRRTNYFLGSAFRYFTDKSCPYCSGRDVSVIDRKYVVTRLLECNQCHLYFRHPKDRPDFNKNFYQDEYEEFGITTHIPERSLLEEYKKNNFKNSGKDFSPYIQIMQMLRGKKDIKLVDYGTSWGYASFQFKKAGMQVQSFEISRPMARVGNELLDLDIQTDPQRLSPGNEVFFSSHVIEHVSDIRFMLDNAKRLLSEDGLFIACSPNGSKNYRERNPHTFNSLWGMVHPNFLNLDFYAHVFRDNPFIITSDPYNDLNIFSRWNHDAQIIDKTDGEELMVVCSINKRSGAVPS
ncbi:MAG: class I SAM-dependent methyltransferase [Chitinophagales bacterium]